LTVLIDSWAWIEFYAGSEAGERVRAYVMDDDQDVIISTINLAEIYQVALRSFDEKTAEARRRALKNRCDIIAVDEEIAVMAAKIKHDLKWGLGNALIYATAKCESAKVLTGDIHFKGRSDVIYLGK
jgi:predicted nucleic acid-binding protein